MYICLHQGWVSFLARVASSAKSHCSVEITWLGTGSAVEVSHEFYDPCHTNSSPRFEQYTFLKITENISSLLLVFHSPSVLCEQFLSHIFCKRGSICSQQAELSLYVWLCDSTQSHKSDVNSLPSYWLLITSRQALLSSFWGTGCCTQRALQLPGTCPKLCSCSTIRINFVGL